MGDKYNNVKDSFQIFLEERNIPDPDELLGKALKYLKEKGKKVSFKGFDINNSAIVEIDNELFKIYFIIFFVSEQFSLLSYPYI